MRVGRSDEGRFWITVGSRRGVDGGVVAPRLEWTVGRVVRGWACTAVGRSVVRVVGAETGAGGVAGCCLIEAPGVGRKGYGLENVTLEVESVGRSGESVSNSSVEVASRCGRTGGDSGWEESTSDWVAIHNQEVGSLVGAVLQFGHNRPCEAMVRTDYRSSALASPPGYFAARERSIRDTCPSEAECAVVQGHLWVDSSLVRLDGIERSS